MHVRTSAVTKSFSTCMGAKSMPANADGVTSLSSTEFLKLKVTSARHAEGFWSGGTAMDQNMIPGNPEKISIQQL